MKKYRRFLLISAVFGLLIWGQALSGCAPTKLYSIDMKYDASRVVAPAYLKPEGKALVAVITVAEFDDRRRVDDEKIIGRVIEKNGTNVMVFPRYVLASRAVTDGIQDYLKQAGYRAVAAARWNLDEKAMPAASGRLLIGGSIDEMQINTRRGFPTNTYTASVKLTVIFADITEGRIVYTRRIEATSAREHVSFSEDRMGYYASELLGEAIRNVFEDRAVARQIKELATQ